MIRLKRKNNPNYSFLFWKEKIYNMNQKIKILIEKLKDERGKKVIFIAHCILNENTRYLGGAFRKGCIDEIVDELQKQGIGIVQLPCPEQKAWGGILKKYMWYPIGLKNTHLYRVKSLFLPFFIWNTKRIYRKIAKEVVTEIEDYINSGFEVVGIIGIGGSPSCGVNITLDIKRSFEFLAKTNIENLDRNKMNEFGIKEIITKGEGIFIKMLKDGLKKKKIIVKFYEHDLISEINGKKTKIKLNRIDFHI
jgi:predicted secreted protein